jgi:DNA polymerase-3 subunit gamma/tau
LQLELIAARVLLPGAAGEGGYAARLDRLERRLDVGGVPTSAAPLTPLTTEAPVASRATAPVASASSVAMGAPDADASEPAPVASAGSVAMGAPDADASGGATSAPSPSRGPGGLDAAAIRRSWPDVLAKIFETSRGTWTFVSQNAQVLDYDGERLVLGTATGGLLNAFRSGGRTEHVRQALIDVLGVDVRIEAVALDGTGEGGAPATSVAPILAPTVTAEPPALPATTASEPRRQPQTPPRPRPAAPSNASNGEGPTWSRAPGDQGTAPSWATADPEPPPEEPEPPEDDELTPLERARVEAARTPDPETHVADDSAVSADDEDIEALGEVGIPVVERILGGTIIKDELS